MSEHKQQLDESLSALMDGEASEMELHRILKEIDSDPQLRVRWQRYQMVSAVMRRDHSALTMDCSLAVAEAIREEPVYKVRPLQALGGIAGRFAVAASVAAMAVLGVQQLQVANYESAPEAQVAGVQDQQDYSGPVLQFPSTFQPVIEARTVGAGGATRVSQHPQAVLPVTGNAMNHYSEQEVREYIQGLMMRHSSNAALNSNQGMLPYARQPRSAAQQVE